MPKSPASKAEEKVKYGSVKRLKPESLAILSKYSDDPNIAVGKIESALEEVRAANKTLASEKFNAASAPGAAGPMKDEYLKKLVKEAVEEAIKPFVG
jgi:hypothetical protein